MLAPAASTVKKSRLQQAQAEGGPAASIHHPLGPPPKSLDACAEGPVRFLVTAISTLQYHKSPYPTSNLTSHRTRVKRDDGFVGMYRLEISPLPATK